MRIAVDFDGTIVEHQYPKIGKEVPFAIQTNGITFYAINKSYPEEVFDDQVSRKIIADMYIDDRNYGGMPDWGEIYASISGKPQELTPKKKGFRALFSK